MLWGMGWQDWVALTIVTLTAATFVWVRFRPQKVRWMRRTLCSCVAESHSRSQESIIFRARKGARPEVVVRLK